MTPEEQQTVILLWLGIGILWTVAFFLIAGTLSNILAELREFNHHRRLDSIGAKAKRGDK